MIKRFKHRFYIKELFFGSIKLSKNADLDKCKYCGYSIEFDSCSKFLFKDGSMREKLLLLGAGMSSSVHIDNKGRDILILGEGPTQSNQVYILSLNIKSTL